jgi:hypothetical protein
MGLLTLFSDDAIAPTLVSATILSDGVTLRMVFSEAVTGTAALGFTRSTGSISSGAIDGVNVDLTIPKVYAGGSVGTVSYDADTGDLAGAGGDVASFGPVSITNTSEVNFTLLYDSFTDTPGAAITAHTPDTLNSPASGSWANYVNSGTPPVFAIDSATGTTLVRTSASDTFTSVAINAGISDGIVATSSLVSKAGLLCRQSTGTAYWLLFHDVTAWTLYEVNGSSVSRGSYTAGATTAYKAAIVFNGTTIDCYIDGTLRISYSLASTHLTNTGVGFWRDSGSPPAYTATDIYVVNSTDPADIPV